MLSDNRIDHNKIFAILDDLGWHHRSELLHLADKISPEIASRAYIGAVPAQSKSKRRKDKPHIQVKYGKHRIVDETIKSLKRKGYIEVRGKGTEKEVRLVSANGDPRFITECCPCCGSDDPWFGQSGPYTFKIQCQDCGINIERETKPQAIRSWNLRPDKEEQEETFFGIGGGGI